VRPCCPESSVIGKDPGNHRDLRAVVASLGAARQQDLYQGAVWVGLALQACYLAKTSDKLDVLGWVVESLAASRPPAPQPDDDGAVMVVLVYYLFARDAVATKAMAALLSKESAGGGGTPGAGDEFCDFWRIVDQRPPH
jgi:hypothetical protein